jgi:hypothetical protein
MSMAIVTVMCASQLRAQPLEADPPRLDFGEVTVGGDRCLALTLRNTGATPVHILSISHPAEPFPAEFVDSLLPAETLGVDICFAGRLLGPDTSLLRIVYETGAVRDSMGIQVTAFGWDSLAVGIGVTVTAKPGSVLRVPVRVFGDIPASYDIRSFSFTIQFNETMLYPLSQPPGGEGSLAAGMQGATVTVLRDYGSSPAKATFRVHGETPLVNPRTDSILFHPAFLVLQGNAMSTDLTLTRVMFAAGLPRGGAFFKGRFLADSLCYQRLRLVDYPVVLEEVEIESAPNPFATVTNVRCDIHTAGTARVAVYSMLGMEISILHEGFLPAGEHSFAFDAAQLPRGHYICRLTTATGAHASRILVLQ